VPISHPERVLWPDAGLTKLDLARYYERIGDWILPHVAGRPLTLVHCPDGLAGTCHYMKHSKLWSPPALRRVRIQEKHKIGDYLVADTVAAIVSLAQMDILEIHTWNSRADDVERPDRIVIDLDPGPEVRFADVAAGAHLTRRVLDDHGLASFPKTTGGVGLHVVVPLVPRRDWTRCFAFARGIAEAMVRESPRLFTTAIPKKGRERKILVDYLRNNRTNTSVAAFSTRARPTAPVSVPLAWDEVGPRLRSNRFTLRNVERRLAGRRGDPWREYWTVRQELPTRPVT
jgi:bifunctional non-homologous end joining protein LigD